MKMPLDIIQDKMIRQYKLQGLAHQGFVYTKIKIQVWTARSRKYFQG